MYYTGYFISFIISGESTKRHHGTMSEMVSSSAAFRFYEELNDFLENGKRRASFSVVFRGRPAVKDVIK